MSYTLTRRTVYVVLTFPSSSYESPTPKRAMFHVPATPPAHLKYTCSEEATIQITARTFQIMAPTHVQANKSS